MPNALNAIRNENNRLHKELSAENRKILTDMTVYLRSSKIHSYDIEVIRKELLGMAMEAQLRNEKFADAVGEDYKRLCDELMAEGRKMTAYDRLLENSHILLGGIGLLLILEIITGPAIKGILASWDFIMPISLGFVLSTVCAVIAAYVVYSYITKHSFELSPEQPRVRSILFGISFIVVLVSITLFRHWLGGIILFSIHCLIPIGIIAALYFIVRILESKRIQILASRYMTA